MARIVIIGGSGHVGTYLVPALVQRGHEVVNVCRGAARPYRPHPAWKAAEQVVVDRKVVLSSRPRERDWLPPARVGLRGRVAGWGNGLASAYHGHGNYHGHVNYHGHDIRRRSPCHHSSEPRHVLCQSAPA